MKYDNNIRRETSLEKLAKLKKPSDAVSRLAGKKKKGPGAEVKAPSQIVFDRSQMKDEKPADEWSALKQRVHRILVETMDLKKNIDVNKKA